ncbi:MAG: DUF2238 domain-containing protein, partial [Planctomycetales bacterium]|nr:DUF2238 domain-containing protein [Planctomycetales bacterium]
MMTTQSPTPKFPWDVTLFTGAYLLPAIGMAVWTRNGEFIFYIVVMLILIAAIAIVHSRCHLSRAMLWSLSMWGLAHMVGGLVPVPDTWPTNGPIKVVYSWWLIPNALKYDQVVHFLGFYVTAIVCWQGFSAIARDLHPTRPLRPTWGVVLLCAAASTGFGALNEVIEFTATLLVPETNVGGYVNTGWDWVSNL